MDFYLFLPGQWWDREKPASQLYEEMLEQAVLAERLGYDGIWLAEQNLVSFLAAPDPLQLAAMIAQRTAAHPYRRRRVCVAIPSSAAACGRDRPDRPAERRAVRRGGRAGASPYQMRQFQAELRGGRRAGSGFAEHLQIMVDQWTADAALAHDGRFFSYPNATVLPPPLQLPHPPLWIAALSARSMEWAVKLGFDSDFIFSPFSRAVLACGRCLRRVPARDVRAGQARSSARFGVNRMTYVGEPHEPHDVLRYVLMNNRVVEPAAWPTPSGSVAATTQWSILSRRTSSSSRRCTPISLWRG